MCAGWGGENSPAACTGSTLRKTPTFPRMASDCSSPEKALSTLKCAMAAPMDNLYLYFQRQKPLKIRSRKGWSNNSDNRACSHTCKQGRWSLFMGWVGEFIVRMLWWHRPLAGSAGGTQEMTWMLVLCWQPATLAQKSLCKTASTCHCSPDRWNLVSQTKMKDTFCFKCILKV